MPAGRAGMKDHTSHTPYTQRLAVAIGAAIVLAAVALTATNADAIPAFARKYDMDCSHCHAMVPRLNPVGTFFHENLSFKGIGAKFPASLEANVGSEDPEDQHPAYWPVSFRVAGGYQFDHRDNQLSELGTELETVTTNTGVLTQLQIMAGGLVVPGISYYLSFFPGATNIGLPGQPPLHIHPGATEGVGQSGSVGYAWVRFADLFGQMDTADAQDAHADGHDHEHASDGDAADSGGHKHAHGFDVIVGALPLELVVSGHERLTNSPYEAYRYNPQGHRTEFALDAPQLGIEVDAPAPWFGYVLAVYNGTSSNADDNRKPDVFGQLKFELADDSRLGLFGVYGTTPTESVSATSIPGTGKANKPFLRLGTNNSLYFGPLNLLLVYLYGQDDASLFDNAVSNPFGSPVQDARFHGGFVEADYLIESARVMLIARYDVIRNLSQGITTIEKRRNDVDALTLALRRDVALTSRVNLQFHLELNARRAYGVAAPGQEVQTLLDATRQISNTVYAGFDLAF